jgi:zinc transporter
MDAPLSPQSHHRLERALSGSPPGVIPGLVWAFRFNIDGTAAALPVDRAIEPHHEGWLWLHIDLANQRALDWLKTVNLPAPAIALMLSRDRHQQLNAVDSLIYGIFADHVRGIDGVSDEVGYLRFLLIDRMLISGRHHALAAAESTRSAIETGACRLPHVASLLELIVEQVADGIDRMAGELEDELDRVEDALADRADVVERKKLASVRRTSVRLHRHLAGLRAVFYRFERQDLAALKPELRLAIKRLAPRLDGLDHSILDIRERGHRLQDEISAIMAEETNKHLHILSVLTALLLPPSLVAGVFGMNVKGLPFAEDDNGFIWVVALLFVASVLVYLLMRRIGVLKR